MSTLIRWNPNRPVLAPFASRFFDDFFGAWQGRGADDESVTEAAWAPAADIRETASAFLVDVELPGLAKEDIDVTLEQNLLTVSGERRFTKDESGESYHRRERAYGRFSRSFRLPRNVENGKVVANFVDGVLRLELPKSEEARPRQIAIN